jgi:shikimate kinase
MKETKMNRIVMIGPIDAGKSTISRLLAENLNIPHYEMDQLREGYYKELGLNKAKAIKIKDKKGPIAFLKFLKPFEAHAVARIIEDYEYGIIDLGAGHSVYENKALFKKVYKALAPIEHVILLLPSPDKEECEKILNSRSEFKMVHDLNKSFIYSESNYLLAKKIFYTKGKTTMETYCEILAELDLKKE